MKNSTLPITILIGCLAAFMTASTALAQATSVSTTDQVRAEVESVHELEQQAFLEGDCETMASFYSDAVTFYANGRVIPTLADLVALCERMPRPFEQSATPHDRIHALSETSAYLVRVLEFAPPGDGSDLHKREVVTKVWSKGPAGWKIVHFQSSISQVRP